MEVLRVEFCCYFEDWKKVYLKSQRKYFKQIRENK